MSQPVSTPFVCKQSKCQNIQHYTLFIFAAEIFFVFEIQIHFVFDIHLVKFIQNFQLSFLVESSSDFFIHAHTHTQTMNNSLPYKILYSDGNERCTKCYCQIRSGCIQIAIMMQVNLMSGDMKPTHFSN